MGLWPFTHYGIFGLKVRRRGLRRVNFGPLIGGILLCDVEFFGKQRFCLTREIVDFPRKFGIFSCGNGPRYRSQNFIPDGHCGSPSSALEKLAPIHNDFGKFGENFFGGGPPRGGWGRNLRGRPKNVNGDR